jgi:hypothetical protein
MGWSFVRGAQWLHCEVRAGGAGSDWEILVRLPDGTPRVEHYPDQVSLLSRQFELIRAWKAQGWCEVDSEAIGVPQPVRARKG